MADIRVYTLEEVAEILHLTRRTLYNYIKAGALNAVKIGKYWRVSEESLQDFVRRGTPGVAAIKRQEHQRELEEQGNEPHSPYGPETEGAE